MIQLHVVGTLGATVCRVAEHSEAERWGALGGGIDDGEQRSDAVQS